MVDYSPARTRLSARRFAMAVLATAILPLPSHAALIFSSNFDTGAGTTDGSVISGSFGGTVTIRDSGGAVSGATIVTGGSTLGDGGFLRLTSKGSEGTGLQLGARFTPASPANSLGALFSNAGGIAALNGGFDFFFMSDVKSTTGMGLTNDNLLRFIDAAAPVGGMRFTFTSSTSHPLRMEVIRPGVTTAFNTDALSFEANTIYHVGLTFSTDEFGIVTVKLFGREGTGAIDTSAIDLAGGFLGSTTFDIDETTVTAGFTTGAFDFGKLRSNTGTDTVQEFDSFRLYDSVPATFAAVPEPATASALVAGVLLLGARRTRRKR